jgi:hypothetical protein
MMREIDEMEEKVSFFDVRDCLVGPHKDLARALELACSCDHPDASWLLSVLSGVKSLDEAGAVFVSLQDSDARAVCFAFFLGRGVQFSSLQRCADAGFAFAQACMASRCESVTRLKYAQLAASQGDRDGFYWLGRCFRFGFGCEIDLKRARENYLRASCDGHVWAQGWNIQQDFLLV